MVGNGFLGPVSATKLLETFRLCPMTKLRWYFKRCSKWAVEWTMAASGLGALYRATRHFQDGARILTYHRVSDHTLDSFTVRTVHFRTHMRYLADHHPVVKLGELVTKLSCGLAPEPRTVALTFDDGYGEAAAMVCEELGRHGLSATFFVTTSFLDQPGLPGGPYMTWQDARHLAAAGHSIGSHCVNHRSLGSLGPSDVMTELVNSRDRIIEKIGTSPEGLSYPYGTLRDFSPAVFTAAQTAGYRYAVTAIHGLNHKGCNPYLLRRINLTASDGLATFKLILNGCLDPWYLVDIWASKFQRTQPM
jgi:peptidoglycan/xylan/chitin deacetylase (PgdA/CDA1 family)